MSHTVFLFRVWPCRLAIGDWGRLLAGPLLIGLCLGLLDLGLLAWFVTLMLTFDETLVYPVETVGVIVRVYWLAVPMTLAALTVAVLAWVRRSWHRAWRVHYTLLAVAAVAFLWFLVTWNLLGGRL